MDVCSCLQGSRWISGVSLNPACGGVDQGQRERTGPDIQDTPADEDEGDAAASNGSAAKNTLQRYSDPDPKHNVIIIIIKSCTTYQHTCARHSTCNTLQHTVTHCNILQCTAMLQGAYKIYARVYDLLTRDTGV